MQVFRRYWREVQDEVVRIKKTIRRRKWRVYETESKAEGQAVCTACNGYERTIGKRQKEKKQWRVRPFTPLCLNYVYCRLRPDSVGKIAYSCWLQYCLIMPKQAASFLEMDELCIYIRTIHQWEYVTFRSVIKTIQIASIRPSTLECRIVSKYNLTSEF